MPTASRSPTLVTPWFSFGRPLSFMSVVALPIHCKSNQLEPRQTFFLRHSKPPCLTILKHIHLGRLICSFHCNLGQKKRLYDALRGNVTTVSTNPEICATLLTNGDRSIDEASPRVYMCSIALRVCDALATSSAKLPGSNVSGIALECVDILPRRDNTTLARRTCSDPLQSFNAWR